MGRNPRKRNAFKAPLQESRGRERSYRGTVRDGEIQINIERGRVAVYTTGRARSEEQTAENESVLQPTPIEFAVEMEREKVPFKNERI